MPNEEIQEIYSQLKELKSVDLAKTRIIFNPYKQQLQEILKESLSSPEEMAERICQEIIEGKEKIEYIKGFVSSIRRMLQKEILNKKGLEQIIQTIKDKYQIE